jgi:hypothetical protein
LLASDLCFAWDRDGAKETAFLGVTVGLTVGYSSGTVYWKECSVGTHVFPLLMGMGFSPRP